MKKKIVFMDTSFRDGFQSVFGARVLTDDFLPAVEAAAHAGIDHFEAGGGARFQSLFLYCGESAFDMMDKFHKAAGKNAKLQTLARGINVVALSQQPKDMIDLHAKTFKKHHITHIRNFDALNDVQNLEYSAECIKKYGLHHQVCVTMMELPPGCEGAHDPEFYLKTVKKILDSGLPFDSICFKDASGTSNPQKVYETIQQTKKLIGDDKMIWMHSHATAGVGELQYKAAIEAGAGGICVARKPVSGGTSQPDLLSMVHALKGTDYTLDVNEKKIMEANAVFVDCLKEYFFPPEALAISPEVIYSPMPGGALTANTMMMRDTNTLHLYPQVIEEMGHVIRVGGFGTSVTPVSQFYFQQAYSNVTQGRWKTMADGYAQMVLGYFGKTPVDPDPEVVKIASQQLKKEPFKGNPVDILDAGIPKAKALLEKEGLPVTDENLFILGAMATKGSNQGLDFLKTGIPANIRKISKEKKEEVKKIDDKKGETPVTKTYTVCVDGVNHQVTIAEGSGVITQIVQTPQVQKATTLPTEAKAKTPAKEIKKPGANSINVEAQLPGNILRINFSEGDSVKKGDVLLVLEAMKMETPIASPKDGVIVRLAVTKGQIVQSGELLATIE